MWRSLSVPSRARFTAAVLLTAAALGGSVTGTATAAPGSTTPGSTAPGSTAPGLTAAAAACRSDLPTVRELVLFQPETGVEAVTSAITGACGTLAGYYPEIGVAVATSTDSGFAARMGTDRAYSAQAEVLKPIVKPVERPPSRRAMGVQSISLVGAEVDTSTADRTGEQWNLAMIGADQAHEVQRGSHDVLVGVLDSGIDADHPDLVGALDRDASAGCTTGVPDQRPSAWQASGQHGTHVAGIIAAAQDGAGVTGVAPGVRIASVRVVDAQGFIYPESAVCGFMWAARRGMRIANNSYFVDPWLLTCESEPGQAVVHEALRRAVEYATGHGVLSIAAAGNENLDLTEPRVDGHSPTNASTPRRRPVDKHCGVLPAQLPGVLAVSAVGATGVKSSYSSYGLGIVGVAAPGGDMRQRSAESGSGCILSTVPGGYGRMCGTSMAVPHVAGVAALAASVRPEAGPAELARLVEASASPLACPAGSYDPDSNGTADAQCTTSPSGTTAFYGTGLVNAAAVVATPDDDDPQGE
jgi:subtilisin family serine protease